ncbi:hypothetical protein EMIT0P228_10565 [Pseudomonas brassicacearum]
MGARLAREAVAHLTQVRQTDRYRGQALLPQVSLPIPH